MEERREQQIIKRLFWSLLPVQALAVGLPALNALLDSLIVGRAYGAEGLAAIGFVGPMTLLLTAFSSVIATGAQLLCGRSLGRGDRKEIQAVYSTTLVLVAAFGLLYTAFTQFFPRTLAVLLGSGEESMPQVVLYIRGIGIGSLFSILFSVLLPFLQLDQARKVSTVAVVVLLVTNIGGDLIAANVMKDNLYGIGLATSVSNLLAVAVALPYIIIKSKLFRFRPGLLRMKIVGQILYNGLPNALAPACLVVRGLVVNRFVYMLGGTAAMSAMSIAGNVNVAIGKFVEAGYSGSCRTVASILVGQKDSSSLRDLPKVMVRSAWYLYIISYAILFFFAKPLALFFGADPAHIDVYVMMVRLVNLWYLTNCFKTPPLCIYEAMKCMKEVAVVTVLNQAVFAVVICYLFGERLGLPVVASAGMLSELLTMLVLAVMFIVKARRMPRSLFELCYIPSTISAPREERFKAVIHSREDAVTASQHAINFCKDRGMDAKKAFYCGLCIEEMTVFTIENGFKEQDATIDLRMICENGTASILLRDDSKQFDPLAWLNLCTPEDMSRSIGIRMVKDLAKEMHYSNTLGLNVLTFRF